MRASFIKQNFNFWKITGIKGTIKKILKTRTVMAYRLTAHALISPTFWWECPIKLLGLNENILYTVYNLCGKPITKFRSCPGLAWVCFCFEKAMGFDNRF
jgi:hypothetical protein